MISRRALLQSAFATAQPPVIDTHVHLFSGDPARFPFHPNGPYKPAPAPLEPYLEFARQAGISHTIIVHPEPYQDDHSYLEYCFERESHKGFFKGTCLFDPIDPKTPGRMKDLASRHPGRIVALRVHEMNPPGKPFERGPAIKNRDLNDPAMKAAWRAAAGLGMAIQMHFLPNHAPGISKLAGEFRDVPVILDHMGRAGQGSPEAAEEVLKLARHPRVYFKFSGAGYSSKQKPPHTDAKPLVRRAYDAFGAGRILWGGLGHSMKEFEAANGLFDFMFDFASADARAQIRGLNAIKLFRFPS